MRPSRQSLEVVPTGSLAHLLQSIASFLLTCGYFPNFALPQTANVARPDFSSDSALFTTAPAFAAASTLATSATLTASHSMWKLIHLPWQTSLRSSKRSPRSGCRVCDEFFCLLFNLFKVGLLHRKFLIPEQTEASFAIPPWSFCKIVGSSFTLSVEHAPPSTMHRTVILLPHLGTELVARVNCGLCSIALAM